VSGIVRKFSYPSPFVPQVLARSIEALKYSLGANQTNGLRRTNADKRHCVEIALKEFPKLGNRAVAELCGVYHQLVADARPKVDESSKCEKLIGKDGKTYPAKKPKPLLFAPEPEKEKPHLRTTK
jgi:hypothetical protein